MQRELRPGLPQQGLGQRTVYNRGDGRIWRAWRTRSYKATLSGNRYLKIDYHDSPCFVR